MKSMTYEIRDGSIGDIPFVLDLGRRTIADSRSAYRPAADEALEASYERLIDTVRMQEHVLLIAQAELAPIGFLILVTDLPDEVTMMAQGFVAYMAVEPDARGRGVGSALLSAAEAAARKRGLSHIALMVTEGNSAARELYAQAGFGTERRLLCKPI